MDINNMDLINLIQNWEFPVLSSLLLGIIVAVCPCTLAANITALTSIVKPSISGKRIFIRSLFYILGRTVAYSLLGVFLFYFASGLVYGEAFQYIFGRLIGFIFIFIGVLMLDIIHIHGLADRCLIAMNKITKEYHAWSTFLMGILLAFAFCPYSAAIYFGMMIPLSFTVSYGAIIPLSFAIGSAIPVIVIAWFISYGIESRTDLLTRFQKVELWLRRILAVLFIISGVLFIVEYYLD